MLEQGATPENPSRVINVGSVVGIIPQAAPTHAYDVSKAAVHQLTKKLSADLAPWGATEDVIAKGIPLKRMGNEEDMAGACLYLSSKAGAWCTGVILNVDGGTVGGIQVDLGSNL
jgi:NAD(P)-dependent dehydrogenase (short-subunit alcohol dehydrogenase family)